MARYEDYVKQTDEILQTEIEDASKNQQSRLQVTPEVLDARFSGKSAADIAQSYLELEKLMNRQAQELGQLRSQTGNTVRTVEPEKTKPVTLEDIYENPNEAIRRVVREASQRELSELKEQVSRTAQTAALAELSRRHPGWDTTLATPEFANWVAASPYRQRLAAEANQFDLDAADALFSMYKDTTGIRQREAVQSEARRQLSEATLESSSAPTPRGPQRVDRSKLQEMRIRAKQGDDGAQRWLDDNGDAIFEAYSQGNI